MEKKIGSAKDAERVQLLSREANTSPICRQNERSRNGIGNEFNRNAGGKEQKKDKT